MYTLTDLFLQPSFSSINTHSGWYIDNKKGIHADNNMISFKIMIMILSRISSSSPIS